MLRQLANIAFVIGAAAMAQKYANMAAFMERGYRDIGGEMFVFPMMCFAGYYMTGVDAWRRMRRKKHNRKEAQTNELHRRWDADVERDSFGM